MHLVDVHAHLDHPDFAQDLDLVLKRAAARGVVTIISQGTNHESNVRVRALSQTHPMIKAAFGLYPCEAMNVRVHEGYPRETTVGVDETLAFIEEHAEEIIAIGEVGLDLKESDDLAPQLENLRKIIALAKRIRKPLIIHSRKAEEHVLDTLEAEQMRRAVLHCFSGNKKALERGIALGCFFSIPTSVVRDQQFQRHVEMIPLGQLLTETDAPYLAPMRDLRNEPANIRDAIVKIAELKRMDAQEVANALYFNYQKLFQ